MIRPRLVLPLLALVLGACGRDGAEALTGGCPPVVLPSLRVEVVDAGTGANLSEGASGTWTSGTQSGPFQPAVTQTGGELVAYGPGGRYTVVIQHPGYQAWSRDVDIPRPSGCTAATVRVRAALSPAG
jgi:hypothetical protein